MASAPTPPLPPPPPPQPQLPPPTWRVFTDLPQLRDTLTLSQFRFVDRRAEADLIWTGEHIHDFGALAAFEGTPPLLNQFPHESVLTAKNLLAECAQKRYGRQRPWLADTYTLPHELPALVRRWLDGRIPSLEMGSLPGDGIPSLGRDSDGAAAEGAATGSVGRVPGGHTAPACDGATAAPSVEGATADGDGARRGAQRGGGEAGGGGGGGGGQTFIIKPWNMSRSRGVVISRDLSSALTLCCPAFGPRLACAYVERPLLLDGRKFDCRMCAQPFCVAAARRLRDARELRVPSARVCASASDGWRGGHGRAARVSLRPAPHRPVHAQVCRRALASPAAVLPVPALVCARRQHTIRGRRDQRPHRASDSCQVRRRRPGVRIRRRARRPSQQESATCYICCGTD